MKALSSFSAALLGANSFAEDRCPPPSEPIRYACVGDSLTCYCVGGNGHQTYPDRLSDMLGSDWNVLNCGVIGATMLRKGDAPYWNTQKYQDALAFLPNVVSIMLGTNDTKPENWVYCDEFVDNYLEMIDSFRHLDPPPRRIFLFLPTPAFPGNYGITDDIIREGILPRVREVAHRAHLPLVDLYWPCKDHGDWFPDMVHPNPDGTMFMAQLIYPHLIGHPHGHDYHGDEYLHNKREYKEPV
jgi:acyl-CoA thioesterase-1